MVHPGREAGTKITHAVVEHDRARARGSNPHSLVHTHVERARSAKINVADDAVVVHLDLNVGADRLQIQGVLVSIGIKVAGHHDRRIRVAAAWISPPKGQAGLPRQLVGQHRQGLTGGQIVIQDHPGAVGRVVDPAAPAQIADGVVVIVTIPIEVDIRGRAAKLGQVDVRRNRVQIDPRAVEVANDRDRALTAQVPLIGLVGAQFQRLARCDRVVELVVVAIFAIEGREVGVGRVKLDLEIAVPAGDVDILRDGAIDHDIAGAADAARACRAIGRDDVDQRVGTGIAVQLVHRHFKRLPGEGRQQHLVAEAVAEVAGAIVEGQRIAPQIGAVCVSIGQRDVDPVVDVADRQRRNVGGVEQIEIGGDAADTDAAAAVMAIHDHAVGNAAGHDELGALVDQQLINAEVARIADDAVAILGIAALKPQGHLAGMDLGEIRGDRAVDNQLLDIADLNLARAELEMEVAGFVPGQGQQLIGIGRRGQDHVEVHIAVVVRRIGVGDGRRLAAGVGIDDVFEVDAGRDVAEVNNRCRIAKRGQRVVHIDGVGAVAGDRLAADRPPVDIHAGVAAHADRTGRDAVGSAGDKRAFGNTAAIGRHQHVLHAILEADGHRLVDPGEVQRAILANVPDNIDRAMGIGSVGDGLAVHLIRGQDQLGSITKDEIGAGVVCARGNTGIGIPVVPRARAQAREVDRFASGDRFGHVDIVLLVRVDAVDLLRIDPDASVSVRIDRVIEEVDRDRDGGQVEEVVRVEVARNQHRSGAIGRMDALVGRLDRLHLEHRVGAQLERIDRGIGHNVSCRGQVGHIAAAGRARPCDINRQRLRGAAAVGRKTARAARGDRQGQRIGSGLAAVDTGRAIVRVVNIEIDCLARLHRGVICTAVNIAITQTGADVIVIIRAVNYKIIARTIRIKYLRPGAEV